MEYASLWERLLAAIVDIVSLTIITFFVFLCFIFIVGGGYYIKGTGVLEGNGSNIVMLTYIWLIISTVIGWLYYALLESSPVQATLGKKAMKIKVTDIDGDAIDFKRASLRYLGRCISHTTIGVLYIIVAFTRKRQGIHDLLADTVVLKVNEKK